MNKLELRNLNMIESEAWFNSDILGMCAWCKDDITQATRRWHSVVVCQECHETAYLPENYDK
jgi:hypothetical protein